MAFAAITAIFGGLEFLFGTISAETIASLAVFPEAVNAITDITEVVLEFPAIAQTFETWGELPGAVQTLGAGVKGVKGLWTAGKGIAKGAEIIGNVVESTSGGDLSMQEDERFEFEKQ